jgi:hypothetical protein
MKPTSLLFFALVACTQDDDTSDTDTDTDTDPQAGCTELATGRYDGGGSCLGMVMQADLTFDDAACTFTIDNWSMAMGDMPDGGAVSGTDVTLTGPGIYEQGCAGTITADNTFDGTCADGCAFEFSMI